MTKNKAQRYISILLSAILTLSIAGCRAAQLPGEEENFSGNTTSSEGPEGLNVSEASTESASCTNVNEGAEPEPDALNGILFLTYDGDKTAINYMNKSGWPFMIKNGVATVNTVNMMTFSFACDIEGNIRYFYKSHYLENGLVAIYYTDSLVLEKQNYPFEAPSGDFYALHNADFSVADVQLDIPYEEYLHLNGIGYSALNNKYIVAFSNAQMSESRTDILRLQVFDGDGKRISDPTTVPEVEVTLPYTKGLPLYCSMIDVDGKMLLVGEDGTRWNIEEAQPDILFDFNTMTYTTVERDETIRLVNETGRYRWCESDDIHRYMYTYQPMEIMQTPPFLIELSEETQEIRIVRSDTQEVLTTLPSSYYLVDWEPTDDGGFCALFNDTTDDISEFWRYLISLQPWDSRSADIMTEE